jgi:hypothetical protein
MTRLEVGLIFRCFRATIFFEWKREQWPFGGHYKGYQEANRQNEVSRVGIFDRQRGQKLGLNKKLWACPVDSAYRTGVENWRIYSLLDLLNYLIVY